MNSIKSYFTGFFKGLYSLLVGLSVTIREFFTKKVTEEYPDNRATLYVPERWRGNLTMPHDENNEHACTACGICQNNCPNGTITVMTKTITTDEGKPKKALDRYIYNLGQCSFCNLCVITCPFKAIKFDNSYENAIYTKSKLTEQLNQEGSKLREKKNVNNG